MAAKFPPEVELLWAFVRGDMSPEKFESILNDSPNLKTHAGLDLYVELLATNFSDAHSVTERRHELRKHLDEKQRGCECLTIKDRDDIVWNAPLEEMPELKTLDVLQSSTPWIDLERCRSCGQSWLIAQDTVDDRIHFQRLSEKDARAIIDHNHWPTTFDSMENVWPDQSWLELYGFKSLSEWRERQKNKPL
jgi:hypothetical protein